MYEYRMYNPFVLVFVIIIRGLRVLAFVIIIRGLRALIARRGVRGLRGLQAFIAEGFKGIHAVKTLV